MSEDVLVIPLGSKHPERCAEPGCGAFLLLKEGKYGPYYACIRSICPGSASAHTDGTPYGRPATQYVKGVRQQVHALLNDLKERNKWNNDQMYAWIKEKFEPDGPYHVSDMFEPQLKKLLFLLQKREDVRLGGRR